MSTRKALSRREFLRLAGVTAVGVSVAACTPTPLALPPTPMPAAETIPTSADQALQLLKDGNARYVANKLTRPNQSPDRRAEVSKEQKPWAAVWGCIDSRVPPELVFDRGLGDLFVIRTAGQVSDDAALGSLEFAVEEGVKLVMVLGHQNCGAVKSTISTVDANGHAEGHIDALVKGIQPAYDKVKSQAGDKVDNVVRANVALQVEQLKANDILAHALKDGKIKIVGARYDLNTGAVEMTV
jgi:carbonic anhydrase